MAGRLLLREPPGFLVRPPLFGQVARDLREPAHLPAFVVQGRHDDGRPEAAAVLPDAPPFLSISTVGAGRGEDLARLARAAVRVREEDLVRFPDDLLGRVTLDPLRARVPGGDVAAGVEDEDGVVDDLFDEQIEQTRGIVAAR